MKALDAYQQQVPSPPLVQNSESLTNPQAAQGDASVKRALACLKEKCKL
jgi:hypothetical protein